MSVTYDQIRTANDTIRTTNVRGNAYVEVHQRVLAFRTIWPTGYIITEMMSNDGEAGKRTCVFRAEAGYYDEDGRRVCLATGTAYENEGASNINRTSYIENCETSAVGRCLGMIGLGVYVAIASAEEVRAAIAAQDATQSAQDAQRAPKASTANRVTAAQAKSLERLLAQNGLELDATLTHYGVKYTTDMTTEQYADAIAIVERWAEKHRKQEGTT